MEDITIDMDKIEMAKAYSSDFDPQYREVAYDAFLCGYGAKCDAPSSKEPVCLYDGEAPSKQKCGDCTIACSVRVKEEPDKDLEEAAEEYATTHLRNNEFPTADSAFIAGAKWQAEQDDRDVVFWKGMRYAIKGMKEDAVDGIYTKSMDGKNVFVESGALKIDPASVKVGDKVKLIIIKDDGKSD